MYTQMLTTLLYKLQKKLYQIIVQHSNVKLILQLATPHERSVLPCKQMEESKHSVTILGCWISTFTQLVEVLPPQFDGSPYTPLDPNL